MFPEEAYVFEDGLTGEVYEGVSTAYRSFSSVRLDVRTNHYGVVGVATMFLIPLTKAARAMLEIEPEIRS